VQAQNPGTDLGEMSKLEADYRQLLQQRNETAGIEDPDMLQEMNDSWTDYGAGMGSDLWDSDFGMNQLNDMTKFDENGVPILQPYEFGMSFPVHVYYCC